MQVLLSVITLVSIKFHSAWFLSVGLRKYLTLNIEMAECSSHSGRSLALESLTVGPVLCLLTGWGSLHLSGFVSLSVKKKKKEVVGRWRSFWTANPQDPLRLKFSVILLCKPRHRIEVAGNLVSRCKYGGITSCGVIIRFFPHTQIFDDRKLAHWLSGSTMWEREHFLFFTDL